MIDKRVRKGLAFAVIVLFIGVSFQPIIAEKTTSVEKTSDYNNVDFEQAKEYLFQTLIDISNNPEVKAFLNQHKRDLIINNNDNYDCRNAIQKIHKQNPKLLKSILFTKPKMTYEYLEKIYNKGLELYDILGEEESSKFIEYVSTINPELLDELKNIILNDKELSNRVSVLEEMNQELKSDLAFRDFPIICDILLNWFNNISIMVKIAKFFERLGIWAFYYQHKLLSYILLGCRDIFVIYFSFPILILLYYFRCISIFP